MRERRLAAQSASATGEQLPTVGFLFNNAAANIPRTTAFVERLRELGLIDGRTVAIEYRWSEGHPERVGHAGVRRGRHVRPAHSGNSVQTLKPTRRQVEVARCIPILALQA